MPKLVTVTLSMWTPFFAKHRPDRIKSFLIYLPNPANLPQVPISTPFKIGKRPVKLIAGGTKYKGRLIGIGLETPGIGSQFNQMWRMDYHPWHHGSLPSYTKADGTGWQDGHAFHYHVTRPPR